MALPFGILWGMKALLYLLGLMGLLVCGCVNQNIAARRSDIPWNAPSKNDAASLLPPSMLDQYE